MTITEIRHINFGARRLNQFSRKSVLQYFVTWTNSSIPEENLGRRQWYKSENSEFQSYLANLQLVNRRNASEQSNRLYHARHSTDSNREKTEIYFHSIFLSRLKENRNGINGARPILGSQTCSCSGRRLS